MLERLDRGASKKAEKWGNGTGAGRGGKRKQRFKSEQTLLLAAFVMNSNVQLAIFENTLTSIKNPQISVGRYSNILGLSFFYVVPNLS